MTVAYWCLMTMILLPYIFNLFAKKNMPSHNNRNPREYLSEVTGKSKRAYWAHQNTLEALPGFAAAVIVAHQCQANQNHLDAICLVYIGLRVGYGLLYIYDRHVLRSAAWITSMACIIALFILAAL